ncbi:hypothetical protein DV735_g4133, partial [Chaetothyriales sp. CBS 134920]
MSSIPSLTREEDGGTSAESKSSSAPLLSQAESVAAKSVELVEPKPRKRDFWRLGKPKEEERVKGRVGVTPSAAPQIPPLSSLRPASPLRQHDLSSGPVSPPRGPAFVSPTSPGALASGSPRPHSPASSMIFERSVQEEGLAPQVSPQIPSHVITENYIPPALDASAEAITNEKLDPDTVEIVTHATHQSAAVTITGGELSMHSSLHADDGSLPVVGPALRKQDTDTASNYGSLDTGDVRRLSFVSFADVVHAEHELVGDQRRDATHLSGSHPLSLPRSPSPARSPVSSSAFGTSPPTSGSILATKGLETSPHRTHKGAASPVPGSNSSVASEYNIETMRQALRRTGSWDMGSVRSATGALGDVKMAWRSSGHTNAELINNLFKSGLIKAPRVRDSMAAVDRAHYAPRAAYEDSPQTIGYSATISAPHMHAMACQSLLPFLPENKSAVVLDVGSGSGYLTHVLANLTCGLDGTGEGKVIGIDHIQGLIDLATNNMGKSEQGRRLLESKKVQFIRGDGRKGYAAGAPYDAIHVGAAAVSLHQELVDQLKSPGRMFIPVDDNDGWGSQYIWVIDKDKDGKVSKKKDIGIVVSIMLTSLILNRRRGYKIIEGRRGRSPTRSLIPHAFRSARHSPDSSSQDSELSLLDDDDDAIPASASRYPPKERSCCGLTTVRTPNTTRFSSNIHSRILAKFPFLIEMFYWALNLLSYTLTKIVAADLLTRGGDVWDLAQEHALQVLHVEHDSPLSVLFPVSESNFQAWFLNGHPDLITFLNRIYSLVHIPGTVTFLSWYYFAAPTFAHFAAVRRTMTLGNFAAFFVFSLWPCMPPRLLPESYGFHDTVRQGNAESVFVGGAYVNQLAAMPSLHFTYAFVIGCTFIYHSSVLPYPLSYAKSVAPKRWAITKMAWFVVGIFYPLLVLTVIVATANHYFLDAVVAMFTVTISFYINRVWFVLLPLEDWFAWCIRVDKPVPTTGDSPVPFSCRQVEN